MRLSSLIFAAMFFRLALALDAQRDSDSIKILLLNGKNGKPMKKERLLVFLGNTPKDVHSLGQGADPHTGEDGFAFLPNEKNDSYLQVWVDYRTLCQSDPNSRTFSIEEVLRLGAQTPNNCGKLIHPNTPGTFIVYARRSTLREQMAR